MPAHSLIGPIDWEALDWSNRDTLEEIAERLGPDAAKVAAQRVGYTLKEFIEAQRGTTPVAQQTKVINGRRVEFRATEQPTALAEIERLAAARARTSGRAAEQCYSEVIGEQPELYARYQQEQAAGRYAQSATTTTKQRSKPATDLLIATAKSYVEEGDEKDLAAAMGRVANESPALYRAYVAENEVGI